MELISLPHACIEIEIPDDEVLLSDFDEWHCVLNRFLVSDTEEEGEQQDAYYETLPNDEKRSYMPVIYFRDLSNYLLAVSLFIFVKNRLQISF